MSHLRRWLGIGNVKLTAQDWLLLLAPLMIFFSYQPLISLGRGSYETHYELSLVELYLAVFALINLPVLWQKRGELIARNDVRLALLFGLYNTLSLAWTPNLARGILTAGLIWLLIIFLCSTLVSSHFKKLVNPLFRVFIASSVFMALFSLYQVFAGSFSVSSQLTLLCPGCEANQFGFARPNAFTIEPQFLGSLLLVPILLLLHQILRVKQPKLVYGIFGFLLFTIVLTMSRGALYSLLIGGLVLLVIDRHAIKRSIIPASIGLASLLLALITQGLAAQLNPSVATSFSTAIATSIDQLTLGKIKLAPKSEQQPMVKNGTQTKPAIFTGYVEHSTNDRLSNSCLAGGIWTESPARALFGVGLGGTGYYFANETTRSAPWCKINF